MCKVPRIESGASPPGCGVCFNARLLCYDTLFCGLLAVAATNIVVRVNASIVSLGAKDFMAIAIQSTAADN